MSRVDDILKTKNLTYDPNAVGQTVYGRTAAPIIKSAATLNEYNQTEEPARTNAAKTGLLEQATGYRARNNTPAGGSLSGAAAERTASPSFLPGSYTAMAMTTPKAKELQSKITTPEFASRQLGYRNQEIDRKIEAIEASRPQMREASAQATVDLNTLENELGAARQRYAEYANLPVWNMDASEPMRKQAQAEMDAAQADIDRIQAQMAGARDTATQGKTEKTLEDLKTKRYEYQVRQSLLKLDEQTRARVLALPAVRESRDGAMGNGGGRNWDAQKVIAMAEREEKEVKRELKAAGLSEGQSEQLIAYAQQQYNAEITAANEDQAAKDASAHPVISTLASPTLSLTGLAGAVDLTLQHIRNEATGDYRPLDFNTRASFGANLNNAMRGAVTEDIRNSRAGDTGAFLYGTATSMLDSGATAALTAATGLPVAYLLGGNAAREAMADAKARGGTDGQAIAYGIAAGAAEEIFEEISIEKLLNMSPGGSLMETLKSVGKQALAEGSEEVNTSLANMISDALIMGDKSQIRQTYQAYRKDGMSDGKASFQTFMDTVKGLGLDFMGGALSGGVMGGVKLGTQAALGSGAQKNSAPEGVVTVTGAESGRAVDPEGNITKLNNGERANPTSLAADGDAGTQSPMLDDRLPQQPTAVNPGEGGEDFDGAENRRALGKISQVLGRQGRELAAELYDGKTKPDQFYKGFAAFYQAGLTGLGAENVQSPYASMLSERQQGQAYQAGRQDARAELKAGRKEAKAAPGWGEDAGVTGDQRSIRRQDAAALEDLAKRAGVKIELTEGLAQEGLYDPETGIVRISTGAKSPAAVVAAHEISHRIAQVAPEEWRDYRDYAVRQALLQSGEALDTAAAVDRKIGEYQRQGIRLDTEGAMDEIAADYTRKLMEANDLFARLAEEKPSLARRLLNSVKDFLRKIFGKQDADQSARESWGAGEDTLREAARRWQRALQAAEERAGKIGNNMENAALGGEDGGKARYSINEEEAESTYKGRSMTEDPGIYSYDFMTKLKPMQTVTLPEVPEVRDSGGRVDTAKVVSDGMKNARTIGMERDGKVFVRNAYTGKLIQVTSESIRHGLNGKENRLLTNSRLGAVIGDVVQNAVPINAMRNTAADVTGTYSMAAYATDSRGREFVAIVTVEQRSGKVVGFESYDSAHAISGRQKNSSQASTKLQGLNPIKAAEISIADLLKTVNSTHQSILSEDVLSRLGEARNPNGDYSDKVKYSAKNREDSLETLAKENRRLREQVDYLKGQTKTSVPGTVRRDTVKRLAKGLNLAYQTDVPLAELTADLMSLYNLMGTGEQDGAELTYETAREMADKVSRKIVENAMERDYTVYQHYEDLRKLVRGTKLLVTEGMKADLEHVGGWNDFRKRNMGRLLLSTRDGTAVDVFFRELSEEYPEFFDQETTENPADQLIRLEDALDSIYTIEEYNPFSRNLDEAAAALSNDIIDRFWTIPKMKTFADVQAAKREEVRARGGAERQRAVKEAVARETKRRREQVQRVHEQYSQRQKEQIAAREAGEIRNSLLKTAQRLEKMRTTEANRERIREALGDLDTVARRMTGKREMKLKGMRDWYNEQLATNPYFIPDPKTEQALSRLEKTGIDELELQDARDLLDALRNIENEISTSKKLIDAQERKDVYHLGEQIISDIENSRGSKGGPLDKYIVSGALSPVRMARRMTGYVDSDPLYRAVKSMQEGETAAKAYQMRASKLFDAWAGDKNFTKRFSGKDADKIQLKGWSRGQMVDVTITPAMRASLYLHSLNPQNLRHMVKGGVTIPDWTLYQKGNLDEAYRRGTTVKLTVPDIRAITRNMTEKERAFARTAQRYFNEVSKPEINKVSEKLKGYSIAKVQNYFPINTDRSFTKSDFDSIKFDGSLEGMGFLKERQQGAVAPLMLRDADAVAYQSIQQHGNYVGMAIPVRNMNKLLGVTTGSFNEDGSRNGYEGSVQKAINQKWGKSGMDYIENMMKDVQNSRGESSSWGKLFQKIRGNYASAVLNMNAGVAIKQAASYPTAAAVLGWEPLTRAMGNVGKVDLALIEKYTPLQWYRTQGYSTRELGDMTSRGKQLPKGLNWIQGADLLTTRKLWKASEYYVQKYDKGLQRGSDAYYRATADIYNQVIQETQPSYSTMDRPDLLRSQDALVSNVMMFKTQPFQNFNVLYDASENLSAKLRQERAGTAGAEDVQEAKRKFAWAVTSQIAQLGVFAGMTAAWALARGKDKKYRDEDGERTWLSFLKAMGMDILSGAASMVPFGTELYDLTNAALTGGNYYGMDAASVSAISDTFGAVVKLSKTVQKLWSEEKPGWKSIARSVDDNVDDLSKALGAPYENVMNLLTAGARQVLRATNGRWAGEYEAMKLTVDPETNGKEYYGLLFRASRQDAEAYEKLYQRMVDDGWSVEKIKSQMETREKAAQGVESVTELEKRWMPPEQDRAYDRVMERVERSPLWQNASETSRGKIKEDLYNLVTAETALQTKEGEKLREVIDQGKDVGLDAETYLLYKLALYQVDKPTESGKLGTYTMEESQEALGLLNGTSNAAKGYLWRRQNPNSREEKNPYKGDGKGEGNS